MAEPIKMGVTSGNRESVATVPTVRLGSPPVSPQTCSFPIEAIYTHVNTAHELTEDQDTPGLPGILATRIDKRSEAGEGGR